jgi:DNA polymerase-3 subunit delta
MSTSKIIGDWQKKLFKPVYWLEGEEDYFIDEVVNYAENHILTESEASFNLSVFYGKDADWTAVINACRRYPMFAERQVVLLKEAQQMRDIDKLEGYIENPQPSTVLVVSYKEKKVDGRSRLAKVLKEKGELLTTKKLYDNQLPEWAQEIIRRKGFTVTPKGLNLLVEHIGNDLARIASEVDKLSVNKDKGGNREITEEDIENYVGISKEYNVFELQNALARKDLAGCIRIIQYFEANPKAGPIQMVLPAMYNFFSKVYQMFGLANAPDKDVASALGVNPFFLKDYRGAARLYGYEGVERVLLLLHHYNLKSLGIGSTSVSDGELMKELVYRSIN